jgi:hypothetical protein
MASRPRESTLPEKGIPMIVTFPFWISTGPRPEGQDPISVVTANCHVPS